MSSSEEAKEATVQEAQEASLEEDGSTANAAEEKANEQEEDADGEGDDTIKEEEESSDDKDAEDGDNHLDQQAEEDMQGPTSIDLSRMKSLYQFRSRPTLPYLLTEYGMEDKDAPILKLKEKEKKKKRKKNKSFGDDTGRDKEREKQQEEKYLQIITDMTRLRDYYYDEYSTLLQNKVDQQRHEIRQRSRAMENKLQQQEEVARQESHHVKRRLERHTFVSDDSFLKDIPKSDLFYIVQLQDRLIRDGTLKSQGDLDNFWHRIQQPDIFYMYFNVPKSDDITARDFTDNASSRAASTWKGSQSTLKGSAGGFDRVPDNGQRQGGHRALSRIAESRETSRPGTRVGNHWAITQQFQAQHREPREVRRRSSFTGLNRQTQAQPKSSFLQDLEKRFPKLEMPKLHCFTMNLGPKPPDPEEIVHQQHLRQLEKNRKKYSYKLSKMHQLAMANAAAASRILELHEDIDFIINGAALTDLISDQHFFSSPPQSPEGQQGPSCSSPVQGREAPGHPVTLPSVLEQDERRSAAPSLSHHSSKPSSGKSKKSRKSSAPQPVDEPPPRTPGLPLTLNEVKGNSRIVEAKCLSTLWTNYMKDTPAAQT